MAAPRGSARQAAGLTIVALVSINFRQIVADVFMVAHVFAVGPRHVNAHSDSSIRNGSM